MRSLLLIGLLAVAGPATAQDTNSGAPDSPATQQDEGRRTPVAWLERPSPEAIRAVLPTAALIRGISGEVVLSCLVTVDGVARDCEAQREDPEGMGFGAAAILLSRQFLLRPARLDGVPVEGRMATTIIFEVDPRGGFGRRRSYLTNPAWLAAPTRAQMDAAFPDPDRGNEGRAVLDCGISTDGELQNCRTLSEVPRGRGFGRAARSLTRHFRLAPFDDDSVRVQVPFQFDLPGTRAARGDNNVMANPDWRSLPDTPSVIETFPEQARTQGFSEGRATVTCRIEPTGATADCVADPADPPGVGFEEAAVTLAALFAINPWSRDGRPFQSERVRIPFRFVDPPPPEGDPPP
ncbi:MAG: energy transducer TonB [Caulobacterales bacterium]|nr:energy transducer TonB [Caulobacterales bacterium]